MLSDLEEINSSSLKLSFLDLIVGIPIANLQGYKEEKGKTQSPGHAG
jgi:hypothetical protein